MTLEDEITEAQNCASEPPKNESNTCDWVILPLLLAAGYARRDIESRIADSTGDFPDYTILPNHRFTFYLEAKAWKVTLEDKYVKQALNYTNHNGKRFVILANGQHWRIYDNAVQGLLAEKLISQATLQDTQQIKDFLTIISKAEVLNGSLERMAEATSLRKAQEVREQQERQQQESELQKLNQRQVKIKKVLDAELTDLLTSSTDDLVILMTDYLTHEKQWSEVSAESLSGWFNQRLNLSLMVQEEQDNPPETMTAASSPAPREHQQTFTLTDLQTKSVDGKKSRPVGFQAPDGTYRQVNSWVQLAVQAVSWLLQQSSSFPLPFEASNHARWFLNSEREHKRSDQRKKFKEISVLGRIIYMDADRSADMFLKDIYALCLAMKISPVAFQITLL